MLIKESSHQLVFDGHVIRSSSHENDLSENGNKYIIPLSPNLKEYKEATKMMELNQVFAYEHSKKKNVIHYELAIEKENTNIFVFKDLSQSILEQNDYLKNLEQGKKRIYNRKI